MLSVYLSTLALLTNRQNLDVDVDTTKVRYNITGLVMGMHGIKVGSGMANMVRAVIDQSMLATFQQSF